MYRRAFILFGIVVYFLLPTSAHAVSGIPCGQWSNAPATCLDLSKCSLLTYSCPDGTTAYYCGPPIPSQICQQFGQSPGGTDTGVNAATLDRLNSAIFGHAPDSQLQTPRGILSKLLQYFLTFGGLILLIMLIWGGFEMLTGAADPKSQEAGKQRITAAIIGFILLFSSYWIAQLVQSIFGISIL